MQSSSSIDEHLDDSSSLSDGPSLEEELAPALEVFQEEEEKERQEKEKLKSDPEGEEKSKRLRNHVILEIINTEETYASDLELLIRVFIERIQKNSKLMKKKYYDKVFSNVTTLAGISRLLLDQLYKHRNSDGTYNIGSVFLDLAEDFKLYTEYCINHSVATKTIELCKQNSNFVSFEKKIIESGETKGLGILDFLIKPIQRICKYPILLKEFLKFTPETHSEYELVTQALDKVEQVVRYINENKKITENQEKLNQIKNSIDGLPNFDFTTPARYLISEITAFTFIKETFSTAFGNIDTVENDEYRLYLFTDLLLYTKIKEKGKQKYVNRIYLDRLRITDIVNPKKDKWSFRIGRRDENSEPLVLFVNSEEEKINFLATAKQVTKEYFKEHQEQLEKEAKRYLQKFEYTNDPSTELRKSAKLKSFFGDVPEIKNSPNDPRFKKTSSDKKSKLEQFFGSEMSHADLKNQRDKFDRLSKVASEPNIAFHSSTKAPSSITKGESLASVLPSSEFSKSYSNLPISSTNDTLKSNTESSKSSKSQIVPSSSRPISHTVSPPPQRPISHTVSPQRPISHTVSPPPQRPISQPPSMHQEKKPEDFQFQNGLRVFPKVDLSQVKLKPVTRRVRVATYAQTYPYAVLIDSNTRPKDVNKDCLERYLDDDEFKQVIGMSKEIFYQLPIWKQNDIKRRNLLG